LANNTKLILLKTGKVKRLHT